MYSEKIIESEIKKINTNVEWQNLLKKKKKNILWPDKSGFWETGEVTKTITFFQHDRLCNNYY